MHTYEHLLLPSQSTAGVFPTGDHAVALTKLKIDISLQRYLKKIGMLIWEEIAVTWISNGGWPINGYYKADSIIYAPKTMVKVQIGLAIQNVFPIQLFVQNQAK